MTIEELNLTETTDTPILQGFKVYANKNNSIKINLINYKWIWVQATQRNDNKYYFNIYYQSEPKYFKYNEHQIGVKQINAPRRFSIPNEKKITEWLEFMYNKHTAFLEAIKLSEDKNDQGLKIVKELENVLNSKAEHYMSGNKDVYNVSNGLFNASIHVNQNTGDNYSNIRFTGDAMDLITFLTIYNDKCN